MSETQFEWDSAKAESNKRKHGIGFQTAILAFNDPLRLIEQDRIEGWEQRWQTIGYAAGVALLLVAHTIHDDDAEDGEIVRIISARRATKQERRRYEQQNR